MEIQSKIIFKDEDHDWESMWEGIERKIIGYDTRLMTVKVKFSKGAVALLHHHPHSQSAYIVKGKFEVNIGKEKKTLSAGDGFYVPPGIEHSVVALEEGLVIDAFSPAREDFLKDK
jgi:quercetin dioxygenase-like cupin family protein